MFDYGEFCPISMATSTLCERWTLQIVREMVLGATRYSEFQKHMPKISPTLLKNRLRFLEEEGIIMRKKRAGQRGFEYQLTPKGKAIEPILVELGKWGMYWVNEGMSDEQLNATTLMRDITAAIDLDHLPSGDTIIQVNFTDLQDSKPQLILIQDGEPEFCDLSMGHDVDVYITGSLRTLTEIWYGDLPLKKALDQDKLKVVADPIYTRNLSKWFKISNYAKVNPRFLEQQETSQ